jgi:hypothetical protein
MAETERVTMSPGSIEAQLRGCKCPRYDNAFGRGAYEVDGKPQFWISEDCPLHGGGTNGERSTPHPEA